MIQLLGDHEIAVPVAGGYHHALAAVYRKNVLRTARRLLDEDRFRPFFLFQKHNTLEVSSAQLSDIDPGLDSLANLNHAQDYLSSLETLGIPLDSEIRKRLGIEPR